MDLIQWLNENKEWLFSGIGVLVVSGITYFLKRKPDMNDNVVTSPTVVINNTPSEQKNDFEDKDSSTNEDKKNIKILFIDDDTKFKVINIIKNAGWKNTKIVKDISNLDSSEVQSTDIFFVDIQGVGKKLNFQDEGLGLANALKAKYPNKKVVIYSAETRGDRFHEALRKADDFLAKNAEPFEFQQTIERLS